MDLLQYSDSIQQTLLRFLVESENEDDDVVMHNSNFTAYYLVELSKRWAERKYIFKKTGVEVTIEDAAKQSLEATQKFFRSKERRAAPARLAEMMVDSEELFAFLEEKPNVKEEPAEEDSSGSGEAEGEKTNGEVPEPREELPEPVATNESSARKIDSAGAEPEGPEHYPVITPEELKKIRRG
jgi:hypothetical protein